MFEYTREVPALFSLTLLPLSFSRKVSEYPDFAAVGGGPQGAPADDNALVQKEKEVSLIQCWSLVSLMATTSFISPPL